MLFLASFEGKSQRTKNNNKKKLFFSTTIIFFLSLILSVVRSSMSYVSLILWGIFFSVVSHIHGKKKGFTVNRLAPDIISALFIFSWNVPFVYRFGDAFCHFSNFSTVHDIITNWSNLEHLFLLYRFDKMPFVAVNIEVHMDYISMNCTCTRIYDIVQTNKNR